jgi:hypothetical protein
VHRRTLDRELVEKGNVDGNLRPPAHGIDIYGSRRSSDARRCVLGDPGPERVSGEYLYSATGHHRPGERTNVSETKAEVLTPLDVEVEFLIPRSSQKKGRAQGAFAPYFRVGRRVYYRRSVFEAWIADQEQQVGDRRG